MRGTGASRRRGWIGCGSAPLSVALLAAAVLTGMPTQGPNRAEECPADGPVVPASELTRPVPVAPCGLAGRTVSAGAVAVAVPERDGESVTAAGSGRTGHPAVLTLVRAGGTVTAVIGGRPSPGGQPPAAPVQRLGRALPGGGDQPRATDRPESAGPPDVRCQDAAGTWLGMRWRSTYRWSMRVRGTPGYLGAPDRVRAAVQAAAQAVDEGTNECGLERNLAQSERFVGDTDRDADIRPDGTCGTRDEHNVVAFGDLGGGLLALTCLWWSRSRTVEADIRISQTPDLFLVDLGPACTDRWDLQGTLTHEFGHVFGLGHVPFTEHGELTMSDGLPACSTRFRSLGLGDYLTLRGQYGTN